MPANGETQHNWQTKDTLHDPFSGTPTVAWKHYRHGMQPMHTDTANADTPYAHTHTRTHTHTRIQPIYIDTHTANACLQSKQTRQTAKKSTQKTASRTEHGGWRIC